MDFMDLTSEEIQPGIIDIPNIPPLTISDELQEKLKQMLQEEPCDYVKVSSSSITVQTGSSYIFIPVQWLYLAVACKKYAEALYVYCDYFDSKIRDKINKDTGKIDNFDEIEMDKEKREKVLKFMQGGKETDFRPGKNLINGPDKKTNKYTVRQTKDILSSGVLNKLPVPIESSTYLGSLIYYLAKRPNVYSLVYDEISKQLAEKKNKYNDKGIKLSSVNLTCAKEIIDHIYDYDNMESISPLLKDTGANIKLDPALTNGLLPHESVLQYMLLKADSKSFDGRTEGQDKAFTDRDYTIKIGDNTVLCRLSTSWKGIKLKEAEKLSGNYLEALIIVVNEYYKNKFQILERDGEYYLYEIKDFSYSNIHQVFHNPSARRYITSLFAKPFVILPGNSGTGKTRISKQFAEYLQVTDENGEKNWALVPVGADWTDNVKVLGYYNPLADNGAGRYEKTEIVELMERANAHPDVPYFLLLDEMNLSHVERYFADFLSKMETPDQAFELAGYEENDGKLKFPDNLFVVGTVNIDETTYMFSPKVLDRANVVEFKPEKGPVLNLFEGDGPDVKITPANDGTAQAFMRLARELRKGTNQLTEDEVAATKELFGEVYNKTEDCGFEFAFRTVREIRQYLNAALTLRGAEADEAERRSCLEGALDEQLLQKIMPKIHGNRREIKNLLEELRKLCEEKELKLPLSAAKVRKMQDKLDKTQYASFI